MKRRILAVFCALSLLLSGCMNSVRLKDRAIVQAVGVDFEEGQYVLTIQYFVPTQSGEGDSETAQNDVFTASGRTMSEAIETATREHGRQVFFGSNKVIVLGRGMAQEDVSRPIDFFNANHQLHPGMYVLLAEGDAAEIVGGSSDAAQIEKLAQTARKHHRMNGGTMLDVVMQIEAGRSAVDLPIIRPGGKDFRIEGAGLVSERQLVDELDELEVQGVLWLRGKIGRNLLQLEFPDGGKCSVELLSGRTRITPSLGEDGALVFQVDIHADCAVRELVGVERGGQELIGEIRNLAQQKILQLCHMALQKTVVEHGADLFELEERVRKVLPGYGKDIQNAAFQIKISCNPSRIGLEAAENKR